VRARSRGRRLRRGRRRCGAAQGGSLLRRAHARPGSGGAAGSAARMRRYAVTVASVARANGVLRLLVPPFGHGASGAPPHRSSRSCTVALPTRHDAAVPALPPRPFFPVSNFVRTHTLPTSSSVSHFVVH
jgi:hypothetical protein